MSQAEYSLSSCIYQKEFSFYLLVSLLITFVLPIRVQKVKVAICQKRSREYFLPFCFSLHWPCLFLQLTWVQISSLISCPWRKAASRWAELRGVSALPGTACTLTCNEDWVAPVQPLHVMHMKTQSEPLLPFPVGGGRRGVLGTSMTQWIFPCLTHFLVFSIYENFYLLRCLNFLSVYCSAFKKLFTSVLTTFPP